MADIQLTEFVLLTCEFRIAPSEAAEKGESRLPVPEPSRWTYEVDEKLKLGYEAERADGEFVLLVSLRLGVPGDYELRVVTGARFEVANLPDLSPEDAAPTLLFIAFPYLRELVSSITMRSPYSAYIMHPLTKLPHPTVKGDEEASGD